MLFQTWIKLIHVQIVGIKILSDYYNLTLECLRSGFRMGWRGLNPDTRIPSYTTQVAHSTTSEGGPAGTGPFRSLLLLLASWGGPGLRPRQDRPGFKFSFKTQPFKSPSILEQGADQGGSLVMSLPFFCSLTALCALALPAPYGLTLWKWVP